MITKKKVKGEGINPKYYERLAMVESSNNPNAKAKTSSAAGLYQFTKGTWQSLVDKAGLDYNFDDRFDPIKSKEVVEIFTKQNSEYLEKKLGRSPTDNELYLSHFLGMGGAKKLIEAYQSFPSASVEDVIGQGSINSNKSIFLDKTGKPKKIKDIYKWSEEKMKTKGVEPPKDSTVYSYDEKGQVVNINPKEATEEQKKYSQLVRSEYIKSIYQPFDNEKNLTNFAETQESSIFAKPSSSEEEDDEVDEVPAWKLALEKKQQERDVITDYISRGGLDFNAPEYERTVLPQPAQQKFEDGGQIPTNPNGVFAVGKNPVRVPTKDGNITMKGVEYPILGIANTGEEILMQPGGEYHFKGATEVLELPQLQRGGEWKEEESFLPSWKQVKTALNPYNMGVDDYSSEKDFGTAYSKARDEGEKEFLYKNKRYNTKYRGTNEEQLKQTGITDNQLQGYNFIRKQLSKNLAPKGYDNKIGRFIEAVFSSETPQDRVEFDKTAKNESGAANWEVEWNRRRTDAHNLYTGKPQKYNTFSISKYKPETNTKSNSDDTYYSITSPQLKQHLLKILNENEEISNKTFKDDSGVMGNYTVNTGKDKKGSFISYYDNWDISPIDYGKPIKIYDKIYYKENKSFVSKEHILSEEEVNDKEREIYNKYKDEDGNLANKYSEEIIKLRESMKQLRKKESNKYTLIEPSEKQKNNNLQDGGPKNKKPKAKKDKQKVVSKNKKSSKKLTLKKKS